MLFSKPNRKVLKCRVRKFPSSLITKKIAKTWHFGEIHNTILQMRRTVSGPLLTLKANEQSDFKFNPFMPNGLFYLNSLDLFNSNKGDVWLFLLLLCFIETPVLKVNRVDPDQTQHPAASDLDLHCLPMSLLWAARRKWVNCMLIHVLLKYFKYRFSEIWSYFAHLRSH